MGGRRRLDAILIAVLLVAAQALAAGAATAAPDASGLTVSVDALAPISLSITSNPNPVLRGDVTSVTVGFSPTADEGTVFLHEVGSAVGTSVNVQQAKTVSIPWWSRTAGTFQLEACFSASPVFAPSCSPILEQEVIAYATTTTLSIAPNPDYPDGALTFDVTVNPAPEVPVVVVVNDITPPSGGGRWNVPVGTDGLGHVVLSGADVQAGLPVGHHDVAAYFAGTLHNDPSWSPTVDTVVRQDPSTTQLTLSSAAIHSGDPLTLSVAVTPAPAAGTPVGVSIGGPIGFGDNATIYLDGAGHGSTVWSSAGAPPSLYTFTATYGGTVRIGPSTDSKSASIGAADPTTTTIDASPTSVGPRGVISFAVAVSPAPGAGGLVIIDVTQGDFTGTEARVLVDASGKGSVDVDTTNWPTGTWGAVARFWGTDAFAPSTSSSVTVTITAPTGAPPALADPRVLDGANQTSCALNGDGGLSCWGAGAWDAFPVPDGAFRSVSLPCAVRVSGEPLCWGSSGSYAFLHPPDGTFLEVAGGGSANCGIRVDHTLACWGDPWYIAAEWSPPTGAFEHLTEGPDHACAIRVDGTVACWGGGGGAVSPSGTFQSVSAGSGFTCGLRPAGTIECWGTTFYGVPSAPTGTFTAMAAGKDSICAIDASADLICSNSAPWAPPTLVDGPFTQLDVGSVGVCARRDTGAVACWGGSQYPYWHIEGAIVTDAPTDGAVGAAYDHLFVANESPRPDFSIVAGTLPSGLSLSSDGRLAGVPTAAGTWAGITIRGTNGIAPVVEQTFSITIADTTAPTVSAPRSTIAAGTALDAGRVPLVVNWSGADSGSGVDHYLWSRQVNGGTWTAAAVDPTASMVTLVAPGSTYRFRVKAVDRAGNQSSWAYGTVLNLRSFQQSSTLVHYHGTWATSTWSGWSGGTARSSSTKGSTALFTFTGKSIAWVGLKAATRGKAYVYINGILKATVDLYSATTLRQRIIWSANYATAATRTITIKVVGTAGRPRVDLDGYIVAS